MFASDVFTIEQFCNHLDSGLFIPYDGFGYYSFDGISETKKPVEFDSASVRKDARLYGFRYVIWYNH